MTKRELAGVSWVWWAVGLMVNDYGTLLVRGLALMALTHEGDCEGDDRVHKNSELQLLVPKASL